MQSTLNRLLPLPYFSLKSSLWCKSVNEMDTSTQEPLDPEQVDLVPVCLINLA